MSRAAANLVKQLARGCETVLGQQKRSFTYNPRYSPKQFSKDTPTDKSSAVVHKNPFIEAWNWRRDHFEREFVWDLRSTFEAFYLIGGFSVAFYALSTMVMRQSDKRNGYPQRDMLGASSSTQFILPDEREFY